MRLDIDVTTQGYTRPMPHGAADHLEQQKGRFEAGTSLAERLVKHTTIARTMQKKLRFVASELAGCERVLEVGTGRGVELGLLLDQLGPNASYTGLDLAAAPLTEARAKLTPADQHRVVLSVAAVEALPFADKTFDGIFCIDVLHHASSQVTMLREIRRILRPGGKVVCVEPNPIYPVNVMYLRDPIENRLFHLKTETANQWVREAGLHDMRLLTIPIYFPSFPAALAGAYNSAERVIGAIPGLRSVSTTMILIARRPGAEPSDG